MGLLDGLVSSVLGSALGGGAQGAASPLGGLLSSLAGSLGGGQTAGAASAGATGAGAVGTAAGTTGAVSAGGLLAAALGLVQGQGGISGLVGKLEQAGLGQHAGSWIGSGPNMPVTGDQLNQALGSGALSQVAAKLGVSPAQAGSTMAQVLPALINHLTPNGQVPQDQHSLLADGLKMLQGLQHA